MNDFNSIGRSLDDYVARLSVPVRSTDDAKKALNEQIFRRGDVVQMEETRYKDRINTKTGLYAKPGYPRLQDVKHMQSLSSEHEFFNKPSDVRDALMDNLSGSVAIGDVCEVTDVFHDKVDDRFYYYLVCRASGKQGWTRCAGRFRKIA